MRSEEFNINIQQYYNESSRFELWKQFHQV